MCLKPKTHYETKERRMIPHKNEIFNWHQNRMNTRCSLKINLLERKKKKKKDTNYISKTENCQKMKTHKRKGRRKNSLQTKKFNYIGIGIALRQKICKISRRNKNTNRIRSFYRINNNITEENDRKVLRIQGEN